MKRAKLTATMLLIEDTDEGQVWWDEQGFWHGMDQWAYGPWPSAISAKAALQDEFFCFIEKRAWNDGTFCDECGASDPKMTLADFGIGSYEFWGARGTHHDYQWVTKCCEAPAVDQAGNPAEYEEPEKEFEYPY